MAEPKGKINKYTCQHCEKQITTINKDDGTTPFMLGCFNKDCSGNMHSCFYRTDQNQKPDYEWRKPTPDEYMKFSTPVRQHIDMGGLILFDINGSTPQPPGDWS